MATPKIVFGAGSIGTTEKSFTFTWDTPDAVSSVLTKLSELDITELDSAAVYPPGNPWNTETLLGQSEAAKKGFIIDTKIEATKIDTRERQKLTDEHIASSTEKSLRLLGVEKVKILYAHVPDTSTPTEVTAKAFHKQFVAGRFEKVRNFMILCRNQPLLLIKEIARSLQLHSRADG